MLQTKMKSYFLKIYSIFILWMPVSSNHLFNPLVRKLQMSLKYGEYCLYPTNSIKIVLVKCSSYI